MKKIIKNEVVTNTFFIFFWLFMVIITVKFFSVKTNIDSNNHNDLNLTNVDKVIISKNAKVEVVADKKLNKKQYKVIKSMNNSSESYSFYVKSAKIDKLDYPESDIFDVDFSINGDDVNKIRKLDNMQLDIESNTLFIN